MPIVNNKPDIVQDSVVSRYAGYALLHALGVVSQSIGESFKSPLHDDVDAEVDHFLSEGTCLEDVGS
jgi:hypothetical protein